MRIVQKQMLSRRRQPAEGRGRAAAVYGRLRVASLAIVVPDPTRGTAAPTLRIINFIMLLIWKYTELGLH